MMKLIPTLCCFSLILTGACSNQSKEVPVQSLSNQSLDISISALPSDWKVLNNADTDLSFAPSDTATEGLALIEWADSSAGTNLIEAIHAHQAKLEARPGGVYLGARELSGPLGTAFYSRGRYKNDAGKLMEETVIFSLHPRKQQIMALRYDYPAAEDSSPRIQSLLGLFGEIE